MPWLLLAATTVATGWQPLNELPRPPAQQPGRACASPPSPGTAEATPLAAAKRARDQAFEHYTRLATQPDQAGDREQALRDYRQASARYQALLNAPATAVAAEAVDPGAAIAVSSGARTTASAPRATVLAPDLMSGVQAAAGKGNARAQSALALIYQTAPIDDADPVRAMALLESAARAGNPDAMAALADEYTDGVWVRQDLRKADTLRRAAAKAGSRLAQWELEL